MMITDEEKTKIILCVGAHWPTNFIPEDKLTEAVNEFLLLPKPKLWVDLIINKKLCMHIAKEKQDGCWIRFSLPKDQ